MATTFITPYARAMDGWQPWQEEYRFGVLLLFVPEPLRSRVNEIRAEHDPRSQDSCDAHVSLTVPLPRGLTEEDWQALEAVGRRQSPFAVRYGPVKHYLPHPGVVLDVGPFDVLDGLRRALETAPPFEGGGQKRRRPFTPHMTLAEFISAERTIELMDELAGSFPKGSWHCDAVSYAVPDEDFRSAERRRLNLG